MSSSTLNIDKIKAQTYLNDACNRIKEAYEFLNMEEESLTLERFGQANEAFNKAKKHNWENYSASCIQMFKITESYLSYLRHDIKQEIFFCSETPTTRKSNLPS